MISTVLLAGICVKLLIVAYVLIGKLPSGKIAFSRVKEALFPQKRVYLTSGIISQYQMKMESETSDVQESTNVEGNEWPDYSSKA